MSHLTQLSIKQLEHLRRFPWTSFETCYNQPRFLFCATWGSLLPCPDCEQHIQQGMEIYTAVCKSQPLKKQKSDYC